MARRAGFLLLAAACCFGPACPPVASGAKILLSMTMIVHTVSHNILFSPITEPLVERGHDVILLAPENKITKGLTPGAITRNITFKNPHTKEEMEEILVEINALAIRLSKASFMDVIKEMRKIIPQISRGCLLLWEDAGTLQKLKEEKLDLIISLPVVGCDALLAEYLNVPLVVMTPLRRSPVVNEDTFGIPVPSSYSPQNLFSTYTDNMTFLQRTANLIYRYTFDPLMQSIIQGPIAHLQKKHNIRPDLSIGDLLGKAKLWLCQSNFALEFAQPTAPNYVSIGGITVKPTKPLPQDLEDFVQGSGEHGVIVFTLGSVVATLHDDDLAETLAKVFSELPQRVLWRYKGAMPRNRGNNTLISDWLPQNDLLGHPKTRLLIYHGGVNGVYEAVGNGVPLLIMPLAGDQMSNAVRVQAKGLGFPIDKNTLTEQSFREALDEILHNPKYAANMKKASGIMKDQIVPTREKIAYYIEHILKFGGDHLRSRALELNFIQRNSLDVVAFLAAVLLMFMVILKWLICKCCGLCMGSKSRSTKSKSD